MTEVINFLLTLVSPEVASIVVFVAYVLAHLVQYLPVTATEKIPDWVMTFLNIVAAKHGATASAKTDIKGNLVDKDV